MFECNQKVKILREELSQISLNPRDSFSSRNKLKIKNFAKSITEPPPAAIIKSILFFRANFIASSACFISGFGSTSENSKTFF